MIHEPAKTLRLGATQKAEGRATWLVPPLVEPALQRREALVFENRIAAKIKPSSPRPISTARLNVSLRLHLRPINLVVYQESYSLMGMGGLISRRASRLDAFSGYPFRT